MLFFSKYEETRAPHVRDLCLLTCNSYNENEVLTIYYTNKDYGLFLVLMDSYYCLTIASGTTNGEASAVSGGLQSFCSNNNDISQVIYKPVLFIFILRGTFNGLIGTSNPI